MPIVLASNTVTENNGGTITGPTPAGTAAGDTLVAFVSAEASAVQGAQAGWEGPFGAWLGTVSVNFYFRVISEGETIPASYTFINLPLGGHSLLLGRLTGVDPLNPVDVAGIGFDSGVASTTLVAPSINTTSSNVIVVYGIGLQTFNGTRTITAPSASTVKVIEDDPAVATGRRAYVFAESRPNAGATGTRTFTSSLSLPLVGTAIAFREALGSATAPVVSAGADTTHTANTAFTRTATENDGGSAITAREWRVMSGPANVGVVLSTTATVSATVITTGTYVVRYTATNAVGSGFDEVTITVTSSGAATAPSVGAGSDATINVGGAFARTATENDGGSAITAREWRVMSGPVSVNEVVSTSAAVSWTPSMTGSYVLRYTATNAVGTGNDSVTLSVADANTVIPTLVHRVNGVPKNGVARVAVRVSDATSVRLKLGTDPAVTTNVAYGPASTPDSMGNVKLASTMLSAGRWYYRVAMTNGAGPETLDTNSVVGTFKVAPVNVPYSFAFNFGGCTNATDSAAVLAAANREDDLFFHIGDLFYDDGMSTTVETFRARFLSKIQAPNHRSLMSRTAFDYGPSDHDAGADDGTYATQPTAWTNWNTVFRELFNNPTIPATRGIYHDWMWGRVHFIRLDERNFKSNPADTDNSTKSALGATQKQWLKDKITNSTGAVIVLIGDTPWIAPAAAGSDAWEGFTTERAELGSFFSASGKKIVMLASDMHALAAHSGVSGSVGNIPVFHGGPLNNTASHKGGPYSVGPYPTTTGSRVEQYGRIVVTDDGTNISLAYTGYSSTNAARISLTKTYSAPYTAPEPEQVPSLPLVRRLPGGGLAALKPYRKTSGGRVPLLFKGRENLNVDTTTGGTGGALTAQTNASHTGAGYTATYHLYADGLDWSRPVGLWVYIDGTGEFGYDNPTDPYLMAGRNGIIATAKRQNLLLLVPAAPDQTKESWDFDDPEGYTTYLESLIRYVYGRYNVDKRRFVGAGYSSGAQVMSRYLIPQVLTRTQPPIALDGLMLMISFGGAPHPVMGSENTQPKANMHLHWDVGDADDAGGYDGTYGALAGESYYRSNGWSTSIKVIPGGLHTRSDFGLVSDAAISDHVSRVASVSKVTTARTSTGMSWSGEVHGTSEITIRASSSPLSGGQQGFYITAPVNTSTRIATANFTTFSSGVPYYWQVEANNPNPAAQGGQVLTSGSVPGSVQSTRGPSGGQIIWEWNPDDGLAVPGIWRHLQNAETTTSDQVISNWPNGTATRTTLPAGSSFDGVGRAVRFECRQGDIGGGAGNRSELSGALQNWVMREGDERWLQYRFKVPNNFAITGPGYFIITQFHSGVGSPPVSISFNADRDLNVGGNATGAPQYNLFTKAEFDARRGTWIDLNLHLINSIDPAIGGVEVYLDGALKVPWHYRATMASEENYLKIGMYRNTQVTSTNQVYFDDVRLTAP